MAEDVQLNRRVQLLNLSKMLGCLGLDRVDTSSIQSLLPSQQDDVDLDALITEMHGERRLLETDFVEQEQGLYHQVTNACTSPVDILQDNRQDNGSNMPKSMSLPLRQMAPDPFPELTPTVSMIRLDSVSSKSSPSSPLVRRVHSPGHPVQCTVDYEDVDNSSEHVMWTPPNYGKTMLNFYSDDRSHKAVLVEDRMKACDVCCLLVLKNRTLEDKHWVIVEHVSKFNLERSLEDHESVLQVSRNWGPSGENRFYFRKDFRKYELFHNPTQFFPPSMLDSKNLKDDASDLLTSKAERQKNLLLKNLFGDPKQLPDIQGHLVVREGKKSWKKHYFVLRPSGLYYSTKGTSKDPRYLVAFCELDDMNIYMANNAKKTLSAPNNYCFVLKPPFTVSDQRELKCFCAEDEQSRLCWVTGLRLAKYGALLRENYCNAVKREEKLTSIENRHGSLGGNNLYVKSRVAMDFTGPGGRVVDDPNEAVGVAIEEGHSWRQKVTPRTTKSPLVGSPSLNPAGSSFLSENVGLPRHGLASGIHMTQPWFHSGISREEAVELIKDDGLIDGVYLVRESHSIPDAYVLSLAHNQKVKHCQINRVESDSQVYFSMDGGHTKFTDLLQLVDFYKLNTSGLPTKLTHYVTRLA